MTVGYDGQLYVDAGLISNGTTFISGGSSANVDFTSAASLTGGTNSFNLPVYVPYTLVPLLLAGNTSFDQIFDHFGDNARRSDPVAQPDRQPTRA